MNSTPSFRGSQQSEFVKHFLYSTYANMEMENEVRELYDESLLYKKYKDVIDALLEEEVYTDMEFKDA